MPPEQPPFLVILDISSLNGPLASQVEYVEPGEGTLRVRWGAGIPPKGYEPKGKGVVFVAGAKTDPKPPDETPNLSLTKKRYSFSEGFDGYSWIMLLMILPKGLELVDPEPPVDGTRLFGDRLAVYWRLNPTTASPDAAVVRWSVRSCSDPGEFLGKSISEQRFPFDADEEEPKFDLFLSYRRKDDGWAAQTIYQSLHEKLGEYSIFLDKDVIQPGEDFRESIDEAVGRCRIVLLLIGPYWFDSELPEKKRRLNREEDWPRIEIEMALQRHKTIIPLLLDETKWPEPKSKYVPESIREIAYRQSMEVRLNNFQYDCDQLTKVIRRKLGQEKN